MNVCQSLKEELTQNVCDYLDTFYIKLFYNLWNSPSTDPAVGISEEKQATTQRQRKEYGEPP